MDNHFSSLTRKRNVGDKKLWLQIICTVVHTLDMHVNLLGRDTCRQQGYRAERAFRLRKESATVEFAAAHLQRSCLFFQSVWATVRSGKTEDREDKRNYNRSRGGTGGLSYVSRGCRAFAVQQENPLEAERTGKNPRRECNTRILI